MQNLSVVMARQRYDPTRATLVIQRKSRSVIADVQLWYPVLKEKS